MTARTPAPAPVAGTRHARGSDARSFVRWTKTGFAYSVTRSTGWQKAIAAVLSATATASTPLLIPLQWWLITRPHTTYLVSDDETATLAIVQKRSSWHLQDFMSEAPGTRQGRHLADQVLPQLLAQTREQGIHITLTAANVTLAAYYADLIPGLHPIGRGWPRGVKMRSCPNETCMHA